MITAAHTTMQFGPEPLFENISEKFGNGHRFGLIGALAPTTGNVSYSPGCTLGTLSQDRFEFEQFTVVDAVIQSNK